MPRRKTIKIANASRVAEVCIRYGCDPFEEMIKLVMDNVKVPEGLEPEAMATLLKDYDVFQGEDGVQRMRLKAMNRFDILKECAQYVYPRLRSSETKIEEDRTLTIVIRTFNQQGVQLDTPLNTGITIPLEQPKEIADGA